MNTETRQLTWIIIGGLIVWGVVHAIGSTGMFVDDAMLNPWKSLIVACCVALFLGLWSIVLLSRSNKGAASSDAAAVRSIPATALSRAGLATIWSGIAGIILWLVAIVTWKSVGTGVTTVLGWLAALGILGSATSGMIALSDPLKRPGKWLGVLGLLGFVLSLISFIARMTPR